MIKILLVNLREGGVQLPIKNIKAVNQNLIYIMIDCNIRPYNFSDIYKQRSTIWYDIPTASKHKIMKV